MMEVFGKIVIGFAVNYFPKRLHQRCVTRSYIFIAILLFGILAVKTHENFQHCVKSVQIRSYFCSVFSCIRTEYGDRKSPYSVRIQENMEQK